ncbi:MAG TPA: lmo0937 family membrane protein [Terriglobales bacterium]
MPSIAILRLRERNGAHCTAMSSAAKCVPKKGACNMLWTIFVILLVLWLLGLVSSYTLGGFIHILLVLAVIVLVINLLTGRRAAL